MPQAEEIQFIRPDLAALHARLKSAALIFSGQPFECLPRGAREPQADYELRVALSPILPRSPGLVDSRIGAIFSASEQIDKAQMQFAVAACRLAMIFGFSVARVKEEAPAQEARSPTDILQSLPGPSYELLQPLQIMDWKVDSAGLIEWLKYKVSIDGRIDAFSPPRPIMRYVICSKSRTELFEYDGNDLMKQEHFSEKNKFVFLQPTSDMRGLGVSIMRNSIEADIAAIRVLSDIVWSLYLTGQPILTFTTRRAETELREFVASAGRYLPLKSARSKDEESEKLDFVQLDPTGVQLMFKLYESLIKEASGQAVDISGQPREQSGLSIAWTFQSGEGRILETLARSVEEFMSDVQISLGQKPNFSLGRNFLKTP